MTRIWFSSRSRFSLTFILVIALISLHSPSSKASRNGIEVKDNRFTVGFTYNDGRIPSVCSGILISPKIIATARHCVRNDSGVAGTGYAFTNPGEQIDGIATPAKVAKILISDEDLAFIILDAALSGTTYLPIANAQAITSLPDRTPLFGYGYGAVFETGSPYSSFVRRYQLDWNITGKVANLKNTYELTSKSSSACRGDSGGPITFNIDGSKESLLAVISGAANVENVCGNPGPDGLYRMRVVLVDPYLSLIPEYSYPIATAKPSPKIIKITCIKGKLKKVVSGVKPKCPKGYTLKK